jgi:hypothetical protein
MFAFGNHRKNTYRVGIACQNIIAEVLKKITFQKELLINGDYKVGEMMTNDKRVPLISATGSTRMGRIVAQTVAGRLGRSLFKQCDYCDARCGYVPNDHWGCLER